MIYGLVQVCQDRYTKSVQFPQTLYVLLTHGRADLSPISLFAGFKWDAYLSQVSTDRLQYQHPGTRCKNRSRSPMDPRD